MPSATSLYEEYKEAEGWAKEFLAHAQWIANQGGGSGITDEVGRLMAHTFRLAHRAEVARANLRAYYERTGRNDAGHDAAITWIQTHIIAPAHNLLNRLGIPYNANWIYDCYPAPSTRRGHARELRDVDHTPRAECTLESSRSCFLNPKNKDEAYFFYDVGCVKVHMGHGRRADYVVEGPKIAINQWSSLGKAGIFAVDAALPNPNDSNEIYFFSGARYVVVSINEDRIVNGPKDIATEWPSLNAAGFQTVDAVLPNPDDNRDAYFFSGTKYALIRIKPGSNQDFILNGPKDIASEWPSLNEAGFRVVDASLPSPIKHGEVYFFSGTEYVVIKVVPGTTDDKIVDGPRPVADNWPSLVEAGIYGLDSNVTSM